MAFELKMPQLGLTMEEGTVSKWVKHEGDSVKAGDVVAEITTDKLTNELTSEVDGTLLKIVAQEGDDIPVKGTLAWIGQPGEQVGLCCTFDHRAMDGAVEARFGMDLRDLLQSPVEILL